MNIKRLKISGMALALSAGMMFASTDVMTMNVFAADEVVTDSEPNNTLVEAQEFSIGAMIEGRLGAYSDKDCYSFELDKAGTVTLDITSYIDTFGYYLELYTSDGELVYNLGSLWNSLKYDTKVGFRKDQCTIHLNAGSYCIMMLAHGQSYGKYVIKTSFTGDDENYTGIKPVGDEFWYYTNGKHDTDKYGFVAYEGGYFLVANGKVATDVNGIAIDPDNPLRSYYCSGGQVQNQYSGLAQYDGAWFMVTKGVMDATVKGFITYDTGLFYVGAGQVQGVNGLAQDPNNSSVWYFCSEGQVQLDYTGLALYDGKWFYIVKGRFQNQYNGNVQHDGKTFRVVNGMIQ
ncbi:MAG: hypothetical protein K6B69_11295 [Lachnospiraceae bacterium]|nr:hypothetical protein [Lachnospiraceae bacterium]